MTSTIAGQTSPAHDTAASGSWLRLAGIAGLAHVVLFIGLVSIFIQVPGDGSVEEIRAHFSEHAGAMNFAAWAALGIFSLLLVYAAGIRHVIAETEVDQAAGGLWSRLWWAGNVTIFAVGIVASAFWGALAQDDVIDSASDGLINALMALDSITFFVCGQWAYFVFGAAAAVVYCRSRSLPTWLGVVSGIAAVLAPVSGLWIVFDDNSYGPWGALGIPSMLLGVVFYVATSIMLIRRSSIA